LGLGRQEIKYYHTGSGRWRYTDTLYKEATARVQHIGEVSLSPRHGYRFRMYIVRAYKPSRGRPRRGERAKSHRWGFGLHDARCNNGRRLEMLLLIAALASLVLWLVGLCGRALDWSRRLQANTERRRPVLSTVFIGRQLLRRPALELPPWALDAAMAGLRGETEQSWRARRDDGIACASPADEPR